MKINLEYDTITKELRFTKDGRESAKLESLNLYERYSEDDKKLYYIDFTEVTIDEDEHNGTRTSVRENTMASLGHLLTQNFPQKSE